MPSHRSSRGWRRTGLPVLLALSAMSCTPHRDQVPTGATTSDAVCRVGPDGGPLVVERGIGGTGAPAGDQPAAARVAERGIGGTGIIGVITGFGSVCVGGEEVALDGSAAVSVDADAADASVLRAGQLVALDAHGRAGSLAARSVAVRHEVSGPVEATGPGWLRVAGQEVVLTSATWMARPPGIGDWVAVSGLRTPAGPIEATRVDPRVPGPVLVHGTLDRDGGRRLRIGRLPVEGGSADERLVGQEVTVTGTLLGAGLQAAAVEPDRLVADPGGYFGAGITALLVEGFVVAEGGGVRVGRTALPAGRGFTPGVGGRRGIVAFTRSGPGFEAVSVGPGGRGPNAGGGAMGPGTPAPGPSRSFGRGGPDRATGSGSGEGRRDGHGPDRNRSDGRRGDGDASGDGRRSLLLPDGQGGIGQGGIGQGGGDGGRRGPR